MSRKQYSLSVLVTARNEEFLLNTVESILKNKRGETEIIVGLDEKWAKPPLKDHPDIVIFHTPIALGQRAMLNQLCRLSNAKYVCKLDAHCIVDEGFDVKMIDAFKETGDNVIMVPGMYNLHAFNWKCKKCGREWYQGRTPLHCMNQLSWRKDRQEPTPECDNTKDFERVIVWQPRLSRYTWQWRFDSDLHFQYWGSHKPEGDLVETMSLVGACFMLTRDKWWELNICDEAHGSWGQQGTEVACKIWLSGGRLICNKRTWFSHLFRTQGGDFGFPYPQSNTQVNHSREYSKDMWFNNKFSKQIYPLSWLLEKFNPDGWSQEERDRVKKLGENFKVNVNSDRI